MKLNHTIGFFKRACKNIGIPGEIIEEWSYRNEDYHVSVEAEALENGHLAAILALSKKEAATDPLAAALEKKIDAFLKVRADPEGAPVGRLEHLATAIAAYLRPTAHKFIFVEEFDGQMVPYFVKNVRYEPADKRHSRPAYVSISGEGIALDKAENYSKTWNHGEIGKGKNVVEVLTEAGIFRETPEAYAAYLKEVARYNAVVDLTGRQFSATGIALGFDPDHSWSSGNQHMERDGVKARIVIDKQGDDEEARGRGRGDDTNFAGDMSFWSTKKGGDEDPDVIALPIHPYVKAFDLAAHNYVKIHVNQIAEYKYDKAVEAKLVLPERTKQLVEVLMESSAALMEDIIAGKTGGTVVIATGAPGTGKTLTAEVYSEHIERPLYSVQCSQLGTDEEALEKELTTVLRRASRWGAILLIDEADVYVRTRGDDIQQNAIVGVFLRLLERYRGVLFLTSNRATEIDDAILSRAIAHVRYELPSDAELTRIWNVLAANYEVKLSKVDVSTLVKEFPGISGRNVKTMLKLATVMSRKTKKAVLTDDLLYVAKFIDLATASK